MDSRDLAVAAALAALSITIAAAFGLVLRGDRWIVPLVAAALLPHVVSALARALRHGTPVIEIGVSSVLLLVGIVLLAGPSPGSVLDAIGAGFDVLERTPPIPAIDGVLVIAAGVVWGAATIADQVVFHHDGSVGAIAPGVVVMIGFASTDTTADLWLPVCAFGVAAIVFLTLEHRRLLERQRTWIGARPSTGDALWLAGGGLLVGLLAVGLSVGGAVAIIDSDRPLVDFGAILPRGEDPTSYNTQVAPLLNVGDELRQPQIETLFTVRADAPAYWRIVALDQYSSRDGGQWTLEAQEDEVDDALDDAVPADALFQQYEIGPALSERWIPAAYRAVEVEGANLGLVVPSSSTLVTDNETIAGARYTVNSELPPDASQINRGAAAAAVPDDVVEFTELPDDVPPIIAETAQTVAGTLLDPVAKAEALRDFFRDPSFVYDPDIRLGDDAAAIDTFMRDRRGFCVQFATAYALMARSLGIPARIGVGFIPGTLDEGTGSFVVTNQDAHAWPELYFTGTGWAVPFDPTPPGNGTLPGGSDLPGEVQPETTPATTPATAAPPPTVPQTSPTPTAGPSDSTPADTPPEGGGVQIDTDETAQDPEPLLPLVALLVLLVLLLVAPVVALLAYKRRRRARRRNHPDRAEAIAGAWREALDTLAEHRVTSSEADTPIETAERVTASTTEAAWPPMSSLATSYSEARYAASAPSEASVDAAWRDIDTLRDALDETAGPLGRVRARFSLRGLRRDRSRDGTRDLDADRARDRDRTAEPV
jgi:transglutaminase-like putative cysteine protease